MAEKAQLFKGVTFRVAAQKLMPETDYYATLRDPDRDVYISSPKVKTDSDGTAIFAFPYEMTNELRNDAILSLMIFEAERDYMAFHKDRLVKVVPTSLKDDKDVEKNQIKNTD